MPNQTHPASEKLTLCYSSPGTQRFFFRSGGYTLGSHPCLITTLQSSSSYMPLYHSPYTVDIYRSKQNYKCNLRMFQHAAFIKDHLLNSVWVNFIFIAIGPTNPRERSLAQVSYSVAFYFQLPPSFSCNWNTIKVYIFPRSDEFQHYIEWEVVQWISSLSMAFATSKEANKKVPSREGFPCGSAGKESTCNVGDLGLIPGLGRYPGEGKLPTPVFWPGEFQGLYSPWGHKQSLLSNFHFTSREGLWTSSLRYVMNL